MLVFEDFLAEKAKELMQLAGSESLLAEKVVLAVPQRLVTAQPARFSNMSIARKAWLGLLGLRPLRDVATVVR